MIGKMLDIRTLLFVSVLFSLLYGIGLVMISLAQQRFKGINLIGLGNLGLGLGFALLGLRGYTPDLLSVLVANGMVLAGTLLYLRGIVRFIGFPWPGYWLDLSILGLQQLLFVFFTFVLPDITARILIMSLMIGILSAICAAVLLWRMPRHMRFQHIITALPFLLLAVYFFYRFLWTIMAETPNNLMHAGTIHAISFVVTDVHIFMASFGIIWIASSRLESELRDQARRDPLTGVFNRIAMEEIAGREMSRSRRHQIALSVIMADLDHFKRLNDTEGHQAGDLTLTSTANLMKTNLRTQDAFARYGGEEFLIILPETNLENAVKVASKLHSLIQANTIKYGPKTLNITASFGVATLNDGEAWPDLISRADLAMYQAKQKGRNRVETG